MKNIKQDIRDNSFKRVYLLYGEEGYLVKLYRDSLSKAALGDGDASMNYSFFDGNRLDVNELKDIATTLPFFADRRVIVLEDCGLFGKEDDRGLGDLVKNLPESTVLIMSEQKADKRTKLYKDVKEAGYVCEFTALKPEELVQFIGGRLAKEGKRITQSDCSYFVSSVGGDLYNLTTELDKVVAYIDDRDTVTRADIDSVCCMQIESRIFELVDSLCIHDRRKALDIYYDLIRLRENPLGILRFVSKQYMRLFSLAESFAAGGSDVQVAEEQHMKDWLVRKYRQQLKGIKRSSLKAALQACADTEEQIKTGNISDTTGLEILLANLSSL